ncbi:hypothetical protein PIROE2DRAFT_15963, partial [Piromyces sp. E2]
YTKEDAQHGRLRTPRDFKKFSDIKIPIELIKQQNFRKPPTAISSLMLKGNAAIFINSKESYSKLKGNNKNNRKMLLDDEVDEEEDSDFDYVIPSAKKKRQNSNNHSSTTTTSTYLTDSDNENDYEFDLSDNDYNHKSSINNCPDDENTSGSTINDIDSISSLSSDLSSISVSTTNDDDINSSCEPDQLFPDYCFNFRTTSISNSNENSKLTNEIKDDETITADDMLYHNNNILPIFDTTELNEDTSTNNSSVFLPINSSPDDQFSYDITNPDFNIFSSFQNTNTFIPIKPNYDLSTSSLNTMTSINMNNINTPISYNNFLKDDDSNNIINSDLNSITSTTNNINNLNNYQCFTNNYDILNDNVLFPSFDEATSSTLLSPFCFTNNNTLSEPINNNFDPLSSFISNDLYPNTSLDLSDYNNEVCINPIENINTDSSNQITSSIPNQNLSLFPFNLGNIAIPNSQLNYIDNNDKEIKIENNNFMTSSSLYPLNKQDNQLFQKNLGLLSIVPYPQILNIMNKKEIGNANLISTSNSSFHNTNNNFNDIIIPNNFNIHSEIHSVPSNKKKSKEKELPLNKEKENFKNTNLEEMDIDECSSNNSDLKDKKTSKVSRNKNKKNKGITSLIKANDESSINDGKILQSKQLSSSFLNDIGFQSENKNKINMELSYLFDFQDINSSLLKDQNNSQSKPNPLLTKTLSPDVEKLSLMNNYNKSDLFNNFDFKN